MEDNLRFVDTPMSFNTNNTETISFREIVPSDRSRIQELFESWFPVDYKDEFYDNLCNQRTMGDQKLYTLLATIPLVDAKTPLAGETNDSHGNDGHRIIACLLGCKLSARKLNDASRTLLIPGYQPKNKSSSSSTNSTAPDTNEELDQAIDKLEASGDPNACDSNNDSNDSSNDDDDDEIIHRTEVFYIMTLGVIEEYRKRGLASYLVERSLEDQIVIARDNETSKNNSKRVSDVPDAGSESCEDFAGAEIYQRSTKAKTPNTGSNATKSIFFPSTPIHNKMHCETAYLHVIIQNEAAIRFYEKLGFALLREIADYYTIDDQKHNCYLYAKFFNKATTEQQRQQNGYYYNYCYYPMHAFVRGGGSPSLLLSLFQRTTNHWITLIWSFVSYYWFFENGEGGRDLTIAAASKNK